MNKEKLKTYLNEPIGVVFSREYENGNKEYWKITRNKPYDGSWNSYPVIKCTKTGKEYKETNGFAASFINRLLLTGENLSFKVIGKFPMGNKANIEDGNRVGAKKRRLRYLEQRIRCDTMEAFRLRDELS